MRAPFAILLAATAFIAVGSPVLAAEVEPAHFHHVHLNVVDIDKSIDFYRRILGGVPVTFRHKAPAVFTERSFILFNKVDEPAPGQQDSGIWHLGWGGVDVPNEYKWLVSQGVDIHTPLYSLGRGHVVYINGPDKEMIEVNTMGHHRYAHIHMFAKDVNATAAFYAEHLGLPSRRNAENNPYPVGPDARYESWEAFHADNRAWSNGFRCDNVSFAVYNQPYYEPAPPWWPFEPLAEFADQRGHAIDHFAFSYADIEPVLERLKAAGVEIVEPISWKEELNLKSFFIMGPDKVTIEIVEAKPIPEGLWDEWKPSE